MSSSSRRSSLVSLVSLVAATLGTSVPHVARASSPARGSIDLCPVTNGGRPCDLSLVADERGGPLHDVFGPVGGLTPDDLQAAYGVPAGGGAGRTVAVWGGNNDLP